MKIKTFGATVLTAMILLSATTPLMSNAFATCFANRIVGIGGGSGTYMWISHDFHGYTGLHLVTAQHLVNGASSITVATNCGNFNESVLYQEAYPAGDDFAVVATTGITFASWYNQATPYVGENVNMYTWNVGSYSGYVKIVGGYQGHPGWSLVCSRTSAPSGASGGPVLDSVLGNIVGMSDRNAGLATDGFCGPKGQVWYGWIIYG